MADEPKNGPALPPSSINAERETMSDDKKNHTFKVWLEIEELDEDGDTVNDQDLSVGSGLRTFNSLDEAQDFCALVEGQHSGTEEYEEAP